ncbi:MAG: bifunctional glutamate N-acetyltransferase/amino-acid acetyltransferase ArgJ [Chloroflexi bacterium]|nr:bifunctional glutamate N-acetyltransferase/amino-acid acetyltransferase ArgJ [Chloroflexota bacterium]
MDNGIEIQPEGTVTTPKGFVAGAAAVGVRSDWEKLDLTLLYSEKPCTTAAVFTTNNLKAAPVLISQSHLADGRAQAVIANSGCANCATGKQGHADAIEMAQLAGEKFGVDPHDVVVASTGVIGPPHLPMEKIASGVKEIGLTPEGGIDFANAIMTTDTVPKYIAAKHGAWTVGGVVKGVGMIHPNMATMLCFLTTDAAVEPVFLKTALKNAVDVSFHMIDIDSDTSTNDMALVMANGMAGGDTISDGHPEAGPFSEALKLVCTHLAKAMVADAEGGTKVIEVRVDGAESHEDARKAAREIVRSPGVKTAMTGHDPNFGRILAAVGNSGAAFDIDNVELYFRSPEGGDLCLFKDGAPTGLDRATAEACLIPQEIHVRVNLARGAESATAWGSDLTEEFVRLNSLYTT